MKRFLLGLTTALLACTGASAQAPLSFEHKTITMVVGFAAGGGTDVSARLLAPYLGKYLPGNPEIIVQNRPGADGLTSANYFANQVKPDGLNVMVGASTITDPQNYRRPEAHYDPTKWGWVGGIGRGGSVLIISKDGEKRLYDKKLEPAVMGSLGGTPHSTQQATAWGIEFLGWNAKWVMGYRGTPDIIVALERGEIDMSGTGNVKLVQRLTDTGKFAVLAQTGTVDEGKVVSRSEFGKNVPMFSDLMKGKIKDPIQQKGFDYWYALLTTDKWLALPPETPKPILDAYRNAFEKLFTDKEFQEKAKAVSEDFELQHAADMEATVKTLGGTPPEALKFIESMLNKQGIGNEPHK
jgi:tripartite-type tricarboxylate transporter receptor subunit TctC